MEYVYIKSPNDEERIAQSRAYFEKKSSAELVEDYNKQVKCGIVGVRAQSLYLIAMRQEFLKRFKDSPVYLRQHILGMRGEVELIDGQLNILNEKKS